MASNCKRIHLTRHIIDITLTQNDGQSDKTGQIKRLVAYLKQHDTTQKCNATRRDAPEKVQYIVFRTISDQMKSLNS